MIERLSKIFSNVILARGARAGIDGGGGKAMTTGSGGGGSSGWVISGWRRVRLGGGGRLVIKVGEEPVGGRLDCAVAVHDMAPLLSAGCAVDGLSGAFLGVILEIVAVLGLPMGLM